MAEELIVGGISAALGYAVGAAQQKAQAGAVPADLTALTNQVSQLTQQRDLYAAQIASLNALRSLDQATGQAATAAKVALQAQVDALTAQISNVTTQMFTGFPIVLGKGDPTLGGWIKGRDGLLISRPLANINPTGMTVGTGTWDGTTPGNIAPLSISNILQSVPARPIQIGKNVNTEFAMVMPRGIDCNVAAVLSFAEDIADDLDFIASFSINGLISDMWAGVSMIGRNSLMVYLLAPHTYYSTIGFANQAEACKHGAYGTVSAYNPATKWSQSTSNPTLIRLSHRSARSLTLRSINIVANPLFAENDAALVKYDDPQGNNWAQNKPNTDSAQLERLTTGVDPRFLRVSDSWNLVSQVVSAAQYM